MRSPARGLRHRPHHRLTAECLSRFQPYDAEAIYAVSDKESRSTWARLIAQVYEVDPLTCSRCGSPMRILAVITEPEEVRKILRHLVKTGRSPPGLDPTSLK